MLAAKYAIICGCCAPASISNCTQRGCTNVAAAVRMGIPCQHACCHSPHPSFPSLSLYLFLSHHAGSKCRFWQENVPHDGEKKVFHASPTHFSLPGNIGNHQQRETKRVAGCKLDVVVCLLPVAHCRLPVACCLAALLTRAWPIMRRAPSGEIDEDAQMQTHSANGQYGAADGVLCTICGPDNYGQNSQLASEVATGGFAALLLLLPAIHAPGLTSCERDYNCKLDI